MQPRAKRALREMMYVSRAPNASPPGCAFTAEYQAKYPKAVVESLVANWNRLIVFFEFSAERWEHLRTTNLIEPPFATVR